MAYMTYNRAMYRTGFRPYGQTNAWAASQLNGYSMREAALSGYLGQSHPFEAAGGWRLHGLDGSASFHPWVLRGLGMAVCLGPDENTIACTDPECTFGDCGSTAEQQVGGPLCLDQAENQISCSSPNCTRGDCIAPAGKGGASITVSLPPGPSPRVNVPPSQFAPTSPSTMQQQPAWMAGTIIKGVPDLLLYGFAAIAAISFIGPGGGRRR